MDEPLRIERASGPAIRPYLPELARLRIDVFRAFPYLYDGDLDYEAAYLQTYVEAPDSLLVLVFDGQRIVGASTALPLADEDDDLRRPFLRQGLDPADFFYLGESVLLPAYRGRGLGHRFFDEREAHARALGRFRQACFCAVERPDDHPRRPPDYRPLDAFWRRRGYRRRPELRTTFSWKDLDEPAASPKPMVFWTRPLAADDNA